MNTWGFKLKIKEWIECLSGVPKYLTASKIWEGLSYCEETSHQFCVHSVVSTLANILQISSYNQCK